MAKYVDGFVTPVPNKNLEAYRKIARRCGKIWIEYGAVAYCECIGEDMRAKGAMSFPKLTGAKRGETVHFSWIVYKSRKHRDAVLEKVMKDPRLAKIAKDTPLFEVKRMAYGGFKTIIEL